MPSSSNDFATEADGVGVIFPVHIWGLPGHVIHFINHLQVKFGTYLFALAVNAGQIAATLIQLKRLMATRGWSLSSGYSIALPSNYIPWGGPGPADAQQRLFTQAREKIKAIAATVRQGKQRDVERGPLWQNIPFSLIYRISFGKVCKMDKNFWADDKCNHCRICAKLCPATNMEPHGQSPWYPGDTHKGRTSRTRGPIHPRVEPVVLLVRDRDERWKTDMASPMRAMHGVHPVVSAGSDSVWEEDRPVPALSSP